jgi:hypothetical protein
MKRSYVSQLDVAVPSISLSTYMPYERQILEVG